MVTARIVGRACTQPPASVHVCPTNQGGRARTRGQGPPPPQVAPAGRNADSYANMALSRVRGASRTYYQPQAGTARFFAAARQPEAHTGSTRQPQRPAKAPTSIQLIQPPSPRPPPHTHNPTSQPRHPPPLPRLPAPVRKSTSEPGAAAPDRSVAREQAGGWLAGSSLPATIPAMQPRPSSSARSVHPRKLRAWTCMPQGRRGPLVAGLRSPAADDSLVAASAPLQCRRRPAQWREGGQARATRWRAASVQPCCPLSPGTPCFASSMIAPPLASPCPTLCPALTCRHGAGALPPPTPRP